MAYVYAQYVLLFLVLTVNPGLTLAPLLCILAPVPKHGMQNGKFHFPSLIPRPLLPQSGNEATLWLLM